jgi:hypothetical protein
MRQGMEKDRLEVRRREGRGARRLEGRIGGGMRQGASRGLLHSGRSLAELLAEIAYARIRPRIGRRADGSPGRR